MTDDIQLLERFATGGDEDAFRELIERHLDLVYSAALRRVNGDAPLAQDVAQTVFTDLARKARSLPRDVVLTGWLYEAARFAAANAIRGERRRQTREKEALTMHDPTSNSTPEWERLCPVLDDAMGDLCAADRNAILLRYFKNQDFQTVGLALGVSDTAARKRVSRAVEHLREFFGKRGVTVGAQGLVLVLSANAVQAAPVGLAVTLSTAAVLGGTTLTTTATATAAKAIAVTATQKVLIAAVLAAAVGTGIYEAREASILRTEVRTLRQQTPLAEQIQQLTGDRDAAARQLAALRSENERLNRNTAELLRLRGEVTRLRGAEQRLAQITATPPQPTNDKLAALARVWAIHANQLKDHISKTPNESIPELQFLDDREWLSAAEHLDLGTEEAYRSAFSRLRETAKKAFVSKLGPALRQYAQANDGRIPSNLLELKPYFQAPFDESILQRYELTQTGKLSEAPGRELVLEKSPVNPEFDTLFKIGPQGFLYEGTGLNKGMRGSGNFPTNGF